MLTEKSLKKSDSKYKNNLLEKIDESRYHVAADSTILTRVNDNDRSKIFIPASFQRDAS